MKKKRDILGLILVFYKYFVNISFLTFLFFLFNRLHKQDTLNPHEFYIKKKKIFFNFIFYFRKGSNNLQDKKKKKKSLT